VRERIPAAAAAEIGAFVDIHLLMLEDAAIAQAPLRAIREQRCNAEWALKMQRDALVGVFEAMDDPYLRSRKEDVDQVIERVQRMLRASPSRRRREEPSYQGRVVFADDLSPADTVLMQDQSVAGLLTEFGGPNSHTAILARSLRIPAVVGLHRARPYLRDDELVIVDGREGVVIVDPDDETLRYYRRLQREIERVRSARRRLGRAPAVTTDGEPIDLQANVELPADVAVARQAGAAGVGLYRTEYLFMNRAEAPDEEEQYEAYRELAVSLRGLPVTIRTLDLGADKQVDGTRPGAPAGSNPALGLRGVRLCLKEQGLFRPQLRAILRVAAEHPVRLMVPMVSNLQEVQQVRQLLEECKAELSGRGLAYDARIPVGAMIEVPAAALCADVYARHLDFLSIGTNDLIQYTIAVDRVDDEVNYLYDPIHLGVLRLIQGVIRAGQRAGVPVAMCGEMAGDARYTRLLLGLGLKDFSVHPNAVLEIKQAINEAHLGKSRQLVQRLMRAVSAGSAATRATLLGALNARGPTDGD
jgi:phosphoenolpyruvate-protein phosphotransferase (PTS system enzyme I)